MPSNPVHQEMQSDKSTPFQRSGLCFIRKRDYSNLAGFRLLGLMCTDTTNM